MKTIVSLALFGCWLSCVNNVTATNYRNESEQLMTLAELLMTSAEY